MEIAVKAMEKQMEALKNSTTQMSGISDLISRQDAIDALSHMCSEDENGITVSRANVNSMLRALPSAQPEQCEYTVSALAVEEMLKNLLPEGGVWEIEGDEAKTAICEVVRSALKGLWKLPFVKPDSKESSLTQKALDNCGHAITVKGGAE